MTKQEKITTILAVAEVFYRRGSAIQYNQLSMDRILRVTPRRQLKISPESATAQHLCFLDCSSFVWAVYHEAFGLEMPSDLTWHMAEVVKPRVYYRTFAHPETVEERNAITAEIKALLEPGDIMVYARNSGNGHAMLYLGEETFMHCCFKNEDGDYDYANYRNRFHDGGSLYRDSLELLFCDPDDTPATRRSLFGSDMKCFAVLRPLDTLDAPTENTRIRVERCRDLDISVLSDVCGGRNAAEGDTVCYSVQIRNLSGTSTPVTVRFDTPDGAELLGSGTAEAIIDDAKTFDFRVRIGTPQAPMLAAPGVSVNGFRAAAHPILLGKKPSQEHLDSLLRGFHAELDHGNDALAAARAAYAKLGVTVPESADICLRPLFQLFDAISGDALYRRQQQPTKDLAVYSLFGGTGVITPEVSVCDSLRTVCLTPDDLMPGDLILAADDSLCLQSYASFYDGTALYGAFSAEGTQEILQGKAMEQFIDSLFGRYLFLVLRPFLGK